MKVTIYQMIPELNFEGLLFVGLSQLKRHGYDEPPAERYETVFSGTVDAENLEDVYRFFNRVTAEDEKRLEALKYRGRSLSVSDIVEVFDINDESRFYYCDMFGFSAVKFQKNKAKLT